VAEVIEKGNLRHIAELMTREMGKPFPEAMGELANVAPIFRYYAEIARDEAGKVAAPIQPGSFQYSRSFPYGTSLHIVPFNFPILLLCWTLAASLAAGNVAIVKPAEPTTLCTWAFLELIAAVLPQGVVSGLAGGAEVGKALVASEHIQVVAFTGSVAAARSVGVACAEQFKPCLLEAGGSDPLLVSDKCNLEVAIAGSVTAAFHLSGQICTSAERFMVHEAVHDRFVEGLVAGAQKLRIGPGLAKSEIGPLVSEAARNKVVRLVEGALAKGARLETGGRIPPAHQTGWFYEPTVLTGVTPEMEIFHEEVFGPVASVLKVGSFDEALRLANDSRFGLGASLFSNDLAESMRFVDEVESGMAWVNNPLIDNDALPFGGWKWSGLGRALGREGLNAFRRTKMAVIDPVPKIHDWWYPYSDEVFF
ncbi:MAG: aldehyde dehydrogenase, partial [Candidatus Eremiobacteraeota bacterium]|nr:aldehyde dehydrogenase [Candidatus Eremiobacteraeota bacterium]